MTGLTALSATPGMTGLTALSATPGMTGITGGRRYAHRSSP